MTAAVELPHNPAATVEGRLAEGRAAGRVVELASGLLLLLDEHGISGRLPTDARAQVGRLRHAVKLAVQTAAGPAMPPPAAPVGAGPGELLRGWLATQVWAKPDPGPLGWVYLLCFRDATTGEHRPLVGNGPGGQYAGHYWGWTSDLVRRIERQHRNPDWSGPGRLVQVALAAGLSFALAWVEYPATPGRERRLKNQGSAYRRCPLCRGTGAPLDPAAVMAAALAVQTGRPAGHAGGRAQRQPMLPDPHQLAPRRELL